MRNIFKIVMLCFLFAGLAACGKVSSPYTIEGSGYPHNYPRY